MSYTKTTLNESDVNAVMEELISRTRGPREALGIMVAILIKLNSPPHRDVTPTMEKIAEEILVGLNSFHYLDEGQEGEALH